MTARKELPIGIQTFAKIREGNHYYVDKTGLALDLIRKGSQYFLSRPRRFGKSLFLDTLKELFEGNEPLVKHKGNCVNYDRAQSHSPILASQNYLPYPCLILARLSKIPRLVLE